MDDKFGPVRHRNNLEMCGAGGEMMPLGGFDHWGWRMLMALLSR